MNKSDSIELSSKLAAVVESFSTAAPGQTVVDAAQQRLGAAIDARVCAPRPARVTRGWLAAAGTACVVAVAALLLPLGGTVAFADVQGHFRHFDSLVFSLEQRVNGRTIQTSNVRMSGLGDVRADVGTDITVIVNQSERRVLTLMHEPRVAMLMPLDEAAKPDDAIAWLDQIRAFQGKAEKLADTRVIRGQVAQAWKLDVEGNEFVLWATSSGLPLAMRVENAALEMDFGFRFNEALDANTFSTALPEGYSLAPAED